MHGRKLVTTGTVALFTLLAVAGGCGEATTGPTSVKPEDFASNLRLISGNQQSGAVGTPLTEVLSVKVVDAGGEPVKGATVLWQIRDGGGTINPPASTSSATGLVSVTWTLGSTLGANKAVAILQGAYVLDSVVFTATAGVGAASQLTLVSGNAQTGRVASALGQVLKVSVKDQFGYAVSGKRVTWAAGSLSGTITPVSDTTDATGMASANWVLGTTAMVQSAIATVTGIATPIAFTATATPDTSRVLTLVSGSGQTATAGATLGTNVVVRVTDLYTNIISGETISFADSTVGGGSLSTQTAVTNASGQASTTWTLGLRIGAQSIRARIQGRPERVSATATATATFASVYAGNYFTCGVTTGDRAFCWGFGEDGQRGVPSAKTANAPGAAVTTADTLIGPFQTWRQIGAGSSYICGISVSRQLYCWGRLATAAQSNVPVLKAFPANVLSFTAVTTSEVHSCALTTEGQIGCTGSNQFGQLGDGTRADQTSDYVVVTTVAPDARLQWSSVVTGGSHTCAFPRFNPGTAADSLNTLRPWCWGANSSGQLGNRTFSIDSTIPQGIVMTGLTQVWDTTSLVAGNAHTCALTRTGAAFCWGANGYGQLGAGLAAVRSNAPVAVTLPAGVSGFTKLFAGEYHTCGIADTGVAYCWGRNNSGQLGDGTTANASAPVAVGGGALTFRSLALGELHTCGVASASGGGSGTQTGPGVIYCWGDNEYGQLGLGTTGLNGVPVVTPSKVAGQP
ncbi:MAG: hypothetical protein H3C62_11275 [Gemmatimonadaceae bacterium]|nr:hypothetical protein [Gemmatimonadaceae bacterium]